MARSRLRQPLGSFILRAVMAFTMVAAFASTASAVSNPDGVAVIIGNANYGNEIPKVDYAHPDAEAMKNYVQNVLGFDKDNIIYLRDATKAELEAVFGNYRNHKGKLWRYADPSGGSDIVVFYSGHGVPGQSDKRGYLLPTNAQPDTAEINGYAIDTLYRNLTKIKARSRTVMMDACFSGESPKGMLIKRASAVMVSAKSLPKKMPKRTKLTVITAADAGQLASWDEGAKHGLFTRHFLDGAYGKADRNHDGRVSVGEIKRYLDKNMTRAARRNYGRDQNASIRGDKKLILARVTGQKNWRAGAAKMVSVAKAPVLKKSKVRVKTRVTTPAKTPTTTAALQKPAASTTAKTRAKARATPKVPAGAAGGVNQWDGIWQDGRGLTVTIRQGELDFHLVLGDIVIELVTTVAADGTVKKTYKNYDRSTIFVSGSLGDFLFEFSGMHSSRGRRGPLSHVKTLSGQSIAKGATKTAGLASVASKSKAVQAANPKLPTNLDGKWQDGQGLTLIIKGSEVQFDLILGDVNIELEATISQDGTIKKTYKNFRRSTIYVFGNLNDLTFEFAGFYSGKGRRGPLKKVE